MQNLLITLKFDGSAYCGWQIQKNSITVQEVFQAALYKITGKIFEVKACSRTDSGVHANKFCVNVKISIRIKPNSLVYALNNFLPNDISVTNCIPVSYGFHARYSCIAKEYTYKIYNGKIRDPFLSRYTFHYPREIYLAKINAGTEILVGEHDFSAFCKKDKKRILNNSIRKIEYFKTKKFGNIIEFKVKANGFLFNMARIMIGTLLKKPDEIKEILNFKNRSNAAPPAPACGLYLSEVFYEKY